MELDPVDRAIINRLQDGFPICEHPYLEAAKELGIGETALIERLGHLLQEGRLSRFGPMYHAERLGGGLSLCAMAIPADELERVSEQVNAFPEVAHNYARDHRFNMWFVVATETPDAIGLVLKKIEHETGYPVYNMPKEKEFFIGLKFTL